MTNPPTSEAEFLQWLRSESQRRDQARLQGRLARLETLQWVSIVLIFFWVTAMFCGYQLRPALITADVAGLVTLITSTGGAYLLWHIVRLKRSTQKQLDTMGGSLTPESPSRQSHAEEP